METKNIYMVTTKIMINPVEAKNNINMKSLYISYKLKCSLL